MTTAEDFVKDSGNYESQISDEQEAWRKMAVECELDPAKDYGVPRYTFKRNGVGFAPLGDLQMIKAPQKNGKTFLISLLIGVLLKGEYLGVERAIDNLKVLFIDTEQHPRNTQLVYRRACWIADLEPKERHENFKAYYFRGKSPEDIKGALWELMTMWRPQVVFIDGIRDLVGDFNDNAESSALVRELMDKALDMECSVWSVLHVNPGSEKARGHLGTEMQNKVSDVLAVQKEKDEVGNVHFIVKQTDARGQDVSDFVFEIESVELEGTERLAVPVPASVSEEEQNQLHKTMAEVLGPKPMKWADLVRKLMEHTGQKEKTCKSFIKRASIVGIIRKDSVYGNMVFIGKQNKQEATEKSEEAETLKADENDELTF